MQDKPTRRMDDGRDAGGKTRPADERAAREPRDDDPKTRLAVPGFARETAAADAASPDPVVGWLVVVDGPGKGRSLTLGYGLNDIGRSPQARVPLDFGDAEIARQQHAMVTFDPRSLRFFVQHGGGKNLTYLGDDPVLAPRELQSGQEILLGRTRLRFVALCGPEFDWQKRG